MSAKRCGFHMRLAPRFALLISFVLVTIVLVDGISKRLAPLPDIYLFEQKWLAEKILHIREEMIGLPPEAWPQHLARSSAGQDWFDLDMIPRKNVTLVQKPLVETFEHLRAKLQEALGPETPLVIDPALPRGDFDRRVSVRSVVVKGIPARMRDDLEDRGLGDVALAGDLNIYIGMPDGAWLHIRTKDVPVSFLTYVRIIAAPVMGILMILIASIFTARSLLRPLQDLSAAAEKLGRERSIVRLPEMHIAEYQSIAEAFSQMQVELKRFVDERTHMLAAISHDLRTPLTRIRLLAEDIADAEKRAHMLQNIDAMDTMIREYLAFARDDARREETVNVDIASLVISVCDTLQDTGLHVSYDGPMHAQLACQPVAMRRVFTNIIENACKYGESAAVILSDNPGETVITIADRGPGIPPAQIEQAFEPFQRLDTSRNRETGGTGLGLSIARDLVHAHGGQIHAENAAAGGLVVRVRLPKPA